MGGSIARRPLARQSATRLTRRSLRSVCFETPSPRSSRSTTLRERPLSRTTERATGGAMKKAIARLPSFDDETGNLNVIVETPQGSRIKYAYEPATGLFEMDKMLPSGMVFPFDFGFIPSTHGEDGDPLDVLVLSEAPLFAGCHVHAQMVGGLRAEQKERDQRVLRNDRLIAVPVW